MYHSINLKYILIYSFYPKEVKKLESSRNINEERVVLVTGSSKAIGLGLVKHFAMKGFKVVINYSKSEARANKAYEEVLSYTEADNILKIKADVSNRKEVKSMFERIIEKFGRIDVLINNAGINLDGPFIKMTDDQWNRVIGTNLTGNFICSQEFARHFNSSEGHIINISSGTAIHGRKNGANYCSSKAGVINLTKCLALELAPKIKVNCIVLGMVDTEEVMTRYQLYDEENYKSMVERIPLGKLGKIDDVVKMIDFIVRKGSYITGEKFIVNGGMFMY